MRAPLDPELLDRTVRLGRDVPTRQAAAFLAGHGIEPTRDLVEMLARLASPAAEAKSDAALLRPLVEALGRLIADDPAQVAAKASALAGPPPAELEAALQRLLAGSPRLQLLDRLIQAVQSAAPQNVTEAESRAAIDSVLARLGSPGSAGSDLPAMGRDALKELLGRLLEIERQEIRAIPELAEARAAQGTALEAADRLAATRLVNQLSLVRNDGIMLLEVPVRADGRVQYIPLRIVRERHRKGPGTGSDETRFSILLDADLTRLGPVRARLDMAGKGLSVLFRARDAAVRAHLERGSGELAEAFHAAGLEVAVRAEVAAPEPRESIFDVFAAPGEPTSIDVQA